MVVRTPDKDSVHGKPELGGEDGIKVDVEREDGAATITVTRPSGDDTQYKLYDPETGESILPDKFDGDKIIFTGVDPSKDYQLIPSEPYKEIPGNADQTGGSKDGAMPLPSKDSGVNIPAADDDVLAEDISAASDGDGKVSVTFPTKDGNTYFVVNDKGEIVGEVTGDGEIATVDGLEPGDYRVVTVPTEDVTDDNKSELVANNTGAHFAVADPVPVGSENAVGGDYIDRTTSGSTETITIADAEDGFSYALVDADGNYYTTSGQPITGDTDPWQAGKGDGSDITFFGLDPNKEYTVLKIPTGADGAVPVGTDVGTRGGAVDASDVSAEYVSDGTVTVTVDDPKADHTYVVTDSTGKVVAVNPTENADGSLSFPGLKPGIEYTVVEIAPEDIEAHGEPKLNDDLSTGDYAQNFEDGVEISAMPSLGNGISVGQDSANDGKAQIVVEPADEELKYVLVDKETGKVVSVKPAENGKVVFDGLDPSTEYEIYTIPKTESDPSGAFPGGDDSIGDPATVTTTTGDELDAAGAASDAVIKEHDKITIPAEAVEDGMDYVLIAPDGSIIEGEKDADGNIVFDDLTPNTDYTLAVRPSGSDEPANLVTAGTVHTPNEPTNVPATVIVSSVQNGTVSVSPSVPAAGDKVTITTKPNAGYELGSITVKDKDGNTLTLTNIGGGRFTYTQPVNGPVTVFVTFVKTGESAVADPSVTGVADLLETDDHISFMNGYPDGSFNPNGNITRAEAAQIFFNLLRDKDVEISGSFSDVSANQWYYDAVMTLSEMGIINGVGGDSYAPGRSITRAEFVTIAMRFANAVETGSSFTDVPGSYWAYGYISGATYYGWINGYEDGSFRPNAPITRAEAAAVVNRMLNRAGDAEYIDANLSSLTTFPDVTRAHWAYYNVLEATNAHDYERSDKGVESWEPKK